MRNWLMNLPSPLQSAFPAGARGLVACVALFAGCTEPDFRDLVAEGGAADAASAAQRDASSLDAAVEASSKPGADAAAAQHDAGSGADARAPDRQEAGSAPDADAHVSNGPDGAAQDEAADAASSSDAALSPGSDAAPTPDATVPIDPAWLDQALGAYGIRIWSYGYDGAVTTLSDAIFLADLKREGGEYQMVTTRCRSIASNNVGRMIVPNPEQLGSKRHRVIVSGGSFSTEPIDTVEAFEAALPPECEGKLGELVAKRPHQDWLASSCRCGGGLAPLRDDCRLLDPDDDGHPGITYELTSVTGTRYELYTVMIDESRIIDVTRRADGTMRGLFEGKSAAIQYGCRPSTCLDLSGPIAWCPPAKYTLVQFAPLTAHTAPPSGWSCAELNAREGVLFPDLPPPLPSTCGR